VYVLDSGCRELEVGASDAQVKEVYLVFRKKCRSPASLTALHPCEMRKGAGVSESGTRRIGILRGLMCGRGLSAKVHSNINTWQSD